MRPKLLQTLLEFIGRSRLGMHKPYQLACSPYKCAVQPVNGVAALFARPRQRATCWHWDTPSTLVATGHTSHCGVHVEAHLAKKHKDRKKKRTNPCKKRKTKPAICMAERKVNLPGTEVLPKRCGGNRKGCIKPCKKDEEE